MTHRSISIIFGEILACNITKKLAVNDFSFAHFNLILWLNCLLKCTL